MLILLMLIIILITVHQIFKICYVSIKLFFSSLRSSILVIFSPGGRVQTAVLSGGSESHVPGGIQVEHGGSFSSDVVEGFELLIEA